MEDTIKNKLDEALRDNLELKNTLKLENEEYNINAVIADVAKHTQANLTLEPSLVTDPEAADAGTFDGSTNKTIKYVPSTGGKFTGPVFLNNGYTAEYLTVENVPEAILNLAQIENKVSNLTGDPCWTWDGETLTAVEKEGVYEKISIIIGEADDFDLEKIRTAIGTDAPCLYICNDEEPGNTEPVSNKILLCLPDIDYPVEISKGADRLNSADSAITSGYYTYETLAAIVAGVNSRLTALGGTALTLPEILKISNTEYTLVPELPDEITNTNDKIIVEENTVATVQQLQEQITKITGGNYKDTNYKNTVLRAKADEESRSIKYGYYRTADNVVNTNIKGISNTISIVNTTPTTEPGNIGDIRIVIPNENE